VSTRSSASSLRPVGPVRGPLTRTSPIASTLRSAQRPRRYLSNDSVNNRSAHAH
jgi:hypothetical protein